MDSNDSEVLERLLERMRAGDDEARTDLIEHCCVRLQRLTRKMLRGYHRLRRWEETDDVFQQATVRLHRSLEQVQPQSPAHFFALAATQIRRTLIDLARHHFGPEGAAAHHHTDDRQAERNQPVARAPDRASEPRTIQEWTEFHEKVESLPEAEREVFNLLWYQGMSQGDAATIVGVDVRTIKRRWQSARLQLHEMLGGQNPADAE